MTQRDIEARVHHAAELFAERGYNCAQAVCGALADLYGMDEETALRVSAGFGGGMGRMHLTCGACSAMVVLAGLKNGQTEAGDNAQKMKNYALVRRVAEDFRRENGSLICSELLQLRQKQPLRIPDSAPDAEWYRSKPCLHMVASAVRIYCNAMGEES